MPGKLFLLLMICRYILMLHGFALNLIPQTSLPATWTSPISASYWTKVVPNLSKVQGKLVSRFRVLPNRPIRDELGPIYEAQKEKLSVDVEGYASEEEEEEEVEAEEGSEREAEEEEEEEEEEKEEEQKIVVVEQEEGTENLEKGSTS
ncbi:hypothetical protein H0E87_023106 [Populus deltoides]|uniref:Uncharacterized protein n=1 Tax=Populus deltoides TaxID=3696 RepID=A0A8T2XEM7_POPDE|nr:hypothetical protein H0E87_023106 [Populus deltoides]